MLTWFSSTKTWQMKKMPCITTGSAFIVVDTNHKLRRTLVFVFHPPGDLCYLWRDQVGWTLGMATVKSHVGPVNYDSDHGGRIFKQSTEQLSYVIERERLTQDAARESRIPDQNVDHATVLSEQPQSSSQPTESALSLSAPFQNTGPMSRC